MLLYQILICICCSIFGYLLGSISPGVILSKGVFKKDIREHGSKNSGATNMGRIFGLKVGLLIIILDMLKSAIAIWVSYSILKYTPLSQYGMAPYGYLFAAFFALFGHCYPIYHKFKGGKAVSSYCGIAVATCWPLTILGLIFYVVFLKIQKKVSLTSILLAIFSSCLSFVLLICPDWFMNFKIDYTIFYSITLCLCALLLVIRHKDNIKRLKDGNESKIKWM